jgi:SAM-dependent methyltransferase
MSPSTPPPRALRSERDRWERLARDPYYAVLTADEHREGRMSVEDRDRFDRSGETDMGQTLDEIRRFVSPGFMPRKAVDFGCGVGRLTIPLARVADEVVALDISGAMLAEARRNCAAHGVENVRFALSDEWFASFDAGHDQVDFVHGYIVFQHMPLEAGLWVADELTRRLNSGGVGALHFTYGRRAPRIRRIVHRLRRIVPGVNALVNLVQGRRASEPFIPMNVYDLGTLFSRLADHGCTHVHARLTDHGGHLGAMLLYRKP